MIVTMTRKEMVKEYRSRKGLLPFAIYQVDREDSDAADLLIERAIDKWYDDLLDTAPINMLHVKDISEEVTANVNDDGTVEVSLPDDFIRLVSARMASWKMAVTSLTMPDSIMGKMQCSPYIRGGAYHPVAMMFSPKKLTLFSASERNDHLQHLMAITRPAEGIYVFDRRALSTLPLIEI